MRARTEKHFYAEAFVEVYQEACSHTWKKAMGGEGSGTWRMDTMHDDIFTYIHILQVVKLGKKVAGGGCRRNLKVPRKRVEREK